MPREGHDQVQRVVRGAAQRISIHVPREGTTHDRRRGKQHRIYFNPRAPRGARLLADYDSLGAGTISIHVPREGHDGERRKAGDVQAHISIHVPREGHDPPAAAAS